MGMPQESCSSKATCAPVCISFPRREDLWECCYAASCSWGQQSRCLICFGSQAGFLVGYSLLFLDHPMNWKLTATTSAPATFSDFSLYLLQTVAGCAGQN